MPNWKKVITSGSSAALGELRVTGHITSSGRIQTLSHITASGNISSSGTIIAAKANINGGTDASLTDGSGYLVLGDEQATNIVFDNNEISARNNAAYSTLYFQADGGGFNVHNNTGGLFNISHEGHVTASGNISSSGYIQTAELHGEGSKTQLFVQGQITASGNISSSGIITGEGLVISDDASITDDLNIGGDITAVTNINLSNDLSFANNSKIQSTNEANTHITLYNDDYWKFTANNAYVAAFASNGATFNEDGVANCNFRVESDNDQYALYIDGGDNTIELGRQATTHITASGNIKTAGYISASGNIYSDNVEILAQGSARVATITNTTQYWGPNDQGPYHTANWNQGTTPESNGNLIFTRGEAQRGFILPYSASLVGFDAITRMNSGEDVFVSMSLFTANTNDMDLANASSNAANFTLVHRCTGMTAGRKDSNSYMLTASCDIPLAPLSVIFPQIKIDASDDSASDVSSGDGDDNSMTCDLTYVIKIKRIKE